MSSGLRPAKVRRLYGSPQPPSAELRRKGPFDRRTNRYNPRALLNMAHRLPRAMRSTTLCAGVFTALAAVLPRVASASVVAPDPGQSPTAAAVRMLYLIVIGVGALAILAAPRQILVGLLRAPQEGRRESGGLP